MKFTRQDATKFCEGITCENKNKWITIADKAYEFFIMQGMSEELASESSIKVANNYEDKTKSISESNAFLVNESFSGGISLEAAVFDGNYIKNVRLIRVGWSKNGRYYTKESLATLVPFLTEYSKMFLNHRNEELGRDIRDWISDVRNAHQVENGDIYADVEIADNPELKWIIESVKKNPNALGLSIYSFALREMGEKEGRKGPIVTKFVGHHSVDWVYYPAAGGSFVAENCLALDDVNTALQLYNLYIRENMPKSITVTEDFNEFVKRQEWYELLEWLDYYLFYLIITTDKKADKIEGIDLAFETAKKMYKDICGVLGYLDDVKEGESKDVKPPEIPSKLKKYAEQIINLTNRINLIKENHMDEKAILEAVETKFTSLTEKLDNSTKLSKEVETKTSEISELKSTNTTLENKIKELEEKIKTHETEKAEAEKAKQVEERTTLITKTAEEFKIELDKVAPVIKKTWESSILTSEEVREAMSVHSQIREEASKSGVTPTETKNETKTVETQEFNIDKLKK